MTAAAIVLSPRDGLTIKDPRGFQPGSQAARSLSWPLPPTVAGALRTAVGLGRGFRADGSDRDRWLRLKEEIGVAGPLPVERRQGDADPGWRPLWPAPADALLAAEEGEGRLHWFPPLPPARTARGCWERRGDLADNLWRSRPSLREKPLEMPRWWPHQTFMRWLEDPGAVATFDRRPVTPAVRTDVHLALDPATGAASEGHLFSLETVEPLLSGDGSELGVYVRLDSPAPGLGVLCLGGEQRMASAEELPMNSDPFALPAEYQSRWNPSTSFRLVLVTPAPFAAGWRPDWIDESGHGSVPGTDLAVVLRAAFIPRPVPVSGWDLVTWGPKASRLCVPAGSCYYFEATGRELNRDDLAALWCRQIVLDRQDLLDGYGMAVPGAWPRAPRA
ncbi:MAG: hypothetical protein FJZ01_16450 [Candidatus Sericytochromatia bacterium]|nr:hypothetical protein [Candidatus Tanganyikabacteria bacterium]